MEGAWASLGGWGAGGLGVGSKHRARGLQPGNRHRVQLISFSVATKI